MALHAMWVHGHSATLELNRRGRGSGEDVNGVRWTSIEGLRVGWGVIYRGQDNSSYWMHFAIPTPVIHANTRARMVRAMLLYTTERGVTLNAVHVWDGPNRVFTRDGIAVGGTNTALQDDKTRFELPRNQVFWGMGISALFNFADPGNVTLHTAGIDFDV